MMLKCYMVLHIYFLNKLIYCTFLLFIPDIRFVMLGVTNFYFLKTYTQKTNSIYTDAQCVLSDIVPL